MRHQHDNKTIKRKWKPVQATGCALPTSYLLIDTSELYDYLRTGTIHIAIESHEDKTKDDYFEGQHGSNFYLKWPEGMGDVWCINKVARNSDYFTGSSYQVYGSQYGYIRVEWSRESILIDVREPSETMNVFGHLVKAGWEPEIVGVLRFIRCKRDRIQTKKWRYE